MTFPITSPRAGRYVSARRGDAGADEGLGTRFKQPSQSLRSLGGVINIVSAHGQGTKFEIFLLCVNETAQSSHAAVTPGWFHPALPSAALSLRMSIFAPRRRAPGLRHSRHCI